VSRVTPNRTSHPDWYGSLVSILKRMPPSRDPLQMPAIAIVSYEKGAGVSSVTRALAARMNSGFDSEALEMSDVTISLSSDENARRSGSSSDFLAQLFRQHISSSQLHCGATDQTQNPPAIEKARRPDDLEDSLSLARSVFRFVLVESPPLETSSDISTLAPLVDSVLIVIEANKTTRAQTERLVHNIQMAGGTVLGYVFNKQTFPIPRSIHKLLTRLA
jgi:Mrp family chromosome partitioning ATPase